MKEFKILFLDIDGTILTPDDTIEDSTKDAIMQLQKRGMEIFLATGRPLHEIKELAQELKIKSFIGYNGAYAIFNGDDLFQKPMDVNIVKHFLAIANENKHDVVLYTNSSNVFTSLGTEVCNEFIKKFHLHQNEPFSEDVIDKVLGITLINLTKDNDPALYHYEDSIYLSQVNVDGMRHCYDVIRDNVSKGDGVNMILSHLGIPKECSIAFGDGMNDKEMLLSVGEGFAMENGHPDLFKFAKHKTTSVTQSGVYNGLKKIGLVD